MISDGSYANLHALTPNNHASTLSLNFYRLDALPDAKPTMSKLYCYYFNHFTALWILSGTTRVSQYQKGKTRKVKPIWVYWSKRQ